MQLTNNKGNAPITISATESHNGAEHVIPPNEIFKIDAIPSEVRRRIIHDTPAWIRENGGESARNELMALGAKHQPDRDIIVLATPEMAGLFDWIVALVAAGGLAAALSTASGLLLVISSSVAHDLYYRIMNPQASEQRRLLVGRIVIGIAVIIAGYFGVNPPGFVGEVVAFAFGLAAASFFPVIVLPLPRFASVPGSRSRSWSIRSGNPRPWGRSGNLRAVRDTSSCSLFTSTQRKRWSRKSPRGSPGRCL